jgi:hypothetical protein
LLKDVQYFYIDSFIFKNMLQCLHVQAQSRK